MSTLPIPHPTHNAVMLAKVVEAAFGGVSNNRLDIVVSHEWDRPRLGKAIQVGGRTVPGLPEIVKDRTLFRTSLLGDTLGPFLAYVGQNMKGLHVVIAGTIVGGIDTVQGHVIQLRDSSAWIPNEAQLAAFLSPTETPAEVTE